MNPTSCILVGAPFVSGKQREGCPMDPDAYRTVRLAETLADLGHDVVDLHGTPLGYISGLAGFDAFPPMPTAVPAAHICMIDPRSVDLAEKATLSDSDMTFVDRRVIDEQGIAKPLAGFLARIAAAGGMLHASLDVDFLDPAMAPAVGTTVPGGAILREAHLVMEMLCDSGLVTSLDLGELNPLLDERGRTASLMVDLTALLLGRWVFDRPTHAY